MFQQPRFRPVREILGKMAMHILSNHYQFQNLGSRNIDIYQSHGSAGSAFLTGPESHRFCPHSPPTPRMRLQQACLFIIALSRPAPTWNR